MKSIGITREVDMLGRIVIPKELRKNLDIQSGAPMEFYISDDTIIVQKYHRGCIFCGDIHADIPFKGKMICMECFDSIKQEQ